MTLLITDPSGVACCWLLLTSPFVASLFNSLLIRIKPARCSAPSDRRSAPQRCGQPEPAWRNLAKLLSVGLQPTHVRLHSVGQPTDRHSVHLISHFTGDSHEINDAYQSSSGRMDGGLWIVDCELWIGDCDVSPPPNMQTRKLCRSHGSLPFGLIHATAPHRFTDGLAGANTYTRHRYQEAVPHHRKPCRLH